MDELLPCPFCGGSNVKAIQYAGWTPGDDEPEWWVGCTPCAAGVDGQGRGATIAAWNTRPALSATPLAQMREENERLRAGHQRVVDAWITNNSEGDDYEEGYDDGLKAAHDIARAALKARSAET